VSVLRVGRSPPVPLAVTAESRSRREAGPADAGMAGVPRRLGAAARRFHALAAGRAGRRQAGGGRDARERSERPPRQGQARDRRKLRVGSASGDLADSRRDRPRRAHARRQADAVPEARTAGAALAEEPHHGGSGRGAARRARLSSRDRRHSVAARHADRAPRLRQESRDAALACAARIIRADGAGYGAARAARSGRPTARAAPPRSVDARAARAPSGSRCRADAAAGRRAVGDRRDLGVRGA